MANYNTNVDNTFLVISLWIFVNLFLNIHEAMIGGLVIRVNGQLSTGAYEYIPGKMQICSEFLVITSRTSHGDLQ